MCKVLSALEDRVLAFVVKWCTRATPEDLDDLAAQLRARCPLGQRILLASIFQAVGVRLLR